MYSASKTIIPFIFIAISITFLLLFFSVLSFNNGALVPNVASAVVHQLIGSAVASSFETVFNTLFALIVWIPVFISALFVMMTGKLFDFLIDQTIVNFSYYFQEYFDASITIAWEVFRDIGNIVMIAIFIFIAFAVILNSETYGLKKFGVRILIIAVLINFSLFFTKVVIDISNIIASQFRQEISRTVNLPANESISGVFLQKAGLSNSITGALTNSASNTLGAAFSENGGLWSYTILSILFLTISGSVLLFGSILLFTRFITFLLLMVVSPLAFVAYMTPSLDSYWTKWWNLLLKNALFAPLFLLLLWTSIIIIGGLDGKTDIYLLATNKDGSFFNIEAYFNVGVVIGLLYASTKIASSLSIAGANFAKTIGLKGFSGALRASGLGVAAGVAGRVGRSTIGRGATNLSESKFLRQNADSRNPLKSITSRLALNASKKAADTSFDIRDSKSLAKSLKSAGVNLGTGVGNYDKMIDTEARYQNYAKEADKQPPKETPPQTRGSDQATIQPPQQENSTSGEAKGDPPVSNIQSTPSNDSVVTSDNTPHKAADTADSRGKQNEIEGAGDAIGRTAQKINEEQRRKNSLENISIHNVGNVSPDQTTVNQPRIPSLAREDDAKPVEEKKKSLLRRLGRSQRTQERIDKRAKKLAGKTNEEMMLEKILKKTETTEESVSRLKDNKT